MSYRHWRTNAAMTRAFVFESAETIQWVWDHGVKFKEVKSAFLDSPNKTWHIYPGSGVSLIKEVVKQYTEKGGIFLLETPGKELVFNKDGRVAGVIAQTEEGDNVRVNAKCVILATGGYANNIEMRPFTATSMAYS